VTIVSGTRLGVYEVLAPIGAGGMGEVYRARDMRLGREVAIKVLPQDVAGDPSRLARFEREARSSSALNHPNIVTIHDFAVVDGMAYLVMELVRGESLRQIVQRGPIPIRKLLAIGSQVADGLAAAHEAGIVHRDLKPENIMVGPDANVKILDFGLAKNAIPVESGGATDLHLTRDGTIVGTVGYMSPEQARGKAVDFRADQFSLGVILYEMATARNPFARSTPYETIAAILNEEAAPLELPDAAEHFTWIVERCLAKEPLARYGSTSDLARDLVRLRDRGERRGPTSTKAVRAPWLVLVPIIAAAVLFTYVLVTLLDRRTTGTYPQGDSKSVAVVAPEVVSVRRGDTSIGSTLSPDGRYLAIDGVDASNIQRLWLHDLESGTTRAIAEGTYSVVWSPNSQAIAYFHQGKLQRQSIHGGPAQTICDARPEGIPSWHGDTILFPQFSVAPGIYEVSASGGTARRILVPDRSKSYEAYFWPHFLPDGKRFLCLALINAPDEIEHELLVASIDGRPPQSVGRIQSRALFSDGHLLYVRDGILLAHPFDADKITFRGEARPLVSDLHYFRSTGLADFSVSSKGTLSWRMRKPRSRLVWLDRSGVEIAAVDNALFESRGRLSPDGFRYAVGVLDPMQGVSDVWIYDLRRGSSSRMTFKLFDEKAPIWSPDGRALLYRSDGGGESLDIFRRRIDQTEPGGTRVCGARCGRAAGCITGRKHAALPRIQPLDRTRPLVSLAAERSESSPVQSGAFQRNGRALLTGRPMDHLCLRRVGQI
jgi:hypothetical protein